MQDPHEDGTYQGWTNHATWCVNLHLTNDERMCHYATKRARQAADTNEDGSVTGLALHNAAEAVKDYVETLVLGDDGELQEAADNAGLESLLILDLLGGYLSDVNWREIAEALREE